MASGTDSKTVYIGTLGELMTQMELLKRGIFVQTMGTLFDYDLMTTNHKRIEVKTAMPTHTYKTVRGKKYTFTRWQFRNYDNGNIPIQEQKGRKRECDFYVFIVLNPDQSYKAGYVVPEEAVSGTLMIYIGDNERNRFHQYKERWDLLK